MVGPLGQNPKKDLEPRLLFIQGIFFLVKSFFSVHLLQRVKFCNRDPFVHTVVLTNITKSCLVQFLSIHHISEMESSKLSFC